MNRILPSVVLCVLLIVSAVLSAFGPPRPLQDEDRPVIIVSTGSVILSVAKGSWVREVPGRFRQELATGRDVRTFSATTGTGPTACTVEGEALQVMYGANALTFGRVAPGRAGTRRAAFVNFRPGAAVSTPDDRTLVIDTTDPLVSVTNGTTTCQIVAGRVEVRQLH